MFTGIVEEVGHVVSFARSTDAARLTVHGPLVTAEAAKGESIAVSGVCLTVCALDGERFSADVMAETLARTWLSRLRTGGAVNLERPVRLLDRLGGHLVQGHVDGVGQVLQRRTGHAWEVLRIAPPGDVPRYIVEKGSVTVDGVSLTVSAVGPGWFEVSLIPTTLHRTTLGDREVGEPVNIEVDLIAKYVERLLGGRG